MTETFRGLLNKSNNFFANAASPDLSIKFGITTAGTTSTAQVTQTFNKVHDYLATNPALSGSGNTTKIGGIALGDYIDLVSLSITADAEGGGLTNTTNTDLGANGKLLRLIVVGINSFKVANNIGVENSSAPTHLVFQFKNIPVRHYMNSSDTNVGGYAASGLKTYIMGNFLTGLKAATGLNDDLLWAPARKISRGGDPATATDTVTDALWLPTEWEMSGICKWSSQNYEVDAGQARLEYYQTNADRIKYDYGNSIRLYWGVSPYSALASYFCSVNYSGPASYSYASGMFWCAPAFCVR